MFCDRSTTMSHTYPSTKMSIILRTDRDAALQKPRRYTNVKGYELKYIVSYFANDTQALLFIFDHISLSLPMTTTTPRIYNSLQPPSTLLT